MKKALPFSKDKMSLQPNGSWKKGADARSTQKPAPKGKGK